MELIVLILIAGVAGYFLAGSKYSKPIDDATSKVSETSKGVADKTRSWWGERFGKRAKSDAKPAENPANEPAAEEDKKPAEKSVSRRTSDEGS